MKFLCIDITITIKFDQITNLNNNKQLTINLDQTSTKSTKFSHSRKPFIKTIYPTYIEL